MATYNGTSVPSEDCSHHSVDNYWIRAQPSVNCAILRYFGAPNADPTATTAPTISNPLAEPNLHPLTSPAAPGIPTLGAGDVDLNLNIVFDFASLHFQVNGATFAPPTVPVLLQILSGASTAASLLPAGSVYVLPPNKVVEISLPGGAIGSPHPIHLHGHAFSVIRSAGSSTYNYVDPVKCDVVSIGTSTTDNVTIRFRTDNAGPWIMHCHIDWHLEIGLSVVFAEDVASVATSTHPVAWDSLCPAFNALPAQTF